MVFFYKLIKCSTLKKKKLRHNKFHNPMKLIKLIKVNIATVQILDKVPII